MFRLSGGWRFAAAGLACLLAWVPVQAQTTGTCPASGSSSSSTSSSGTASQSTSASSSTVTKQRVAAISAQIAQMQVVQQNLQSGAVTPSASTGLTSAQAQVVVAQRISALRNVLTQLQASSSAQSAAASQRTTANLARRR